MARADDKVNAARGEPVAQGRDVAGVADQSGALSTVAGTSLGRMTLWVSVLGVVGVLFVTAALNTIARSTPLCAQDMPVN